MTERLRTRQAEHQRKLVAMGCCQRCQKCRGCGVWSSPLERAAHKAACANQPRFARLCQGCVGQERERQAAHRQRKRSARARVERRNAARRAKRRAA